MTGEVGAVSAGLPTAQRPWDSAPGFVDCPIRGRGQVRVGQRSSLVGPLSEGFLEKGKQGRNRVVDTKQRPGKPGFSNSPQHPRKAVETAALWKPWKNSDLAKTTPGGEFFHRSHSACLSKLLRTEFPTVPTASAAGYQINRLTLPRFAGRDSIGIEMTSTRGYNY